MKWLLTPEEIAAIPATNIGDDHDDRQLCKAQLKKILVELGRHITDQNYHGTFIAIDDYVWQGIFKECE